MFMLCIAYVQNIKTVDVIKRKKLFWTENVKTVVVKEKKFKEMLYCEVLRFSEFVIIFVLHWFLLDDTTVPHWMALVSNLSQQLKTECLHFFWKKMWTKFTSESTYAMPVMKLYVAILLVTVSGKRVQNKMVPFLVTGVLPPSVQYLYLNCV